MRVQVQKPLILTIQIAMSLSLILRFLGACQYDFTLASQAKSVITKV